MSPGRAEISFEIKIKTPFALKTDVKETIIIFMHFRIFMQSTPDTQEEKA